ncbi:uncharacterized protein LOC111456714 [Cucurbita moschata]|uniref:Uncharacterized protein LOC111456714 n=1 Tax=Cucurbita moschata TaxID=3662 RepID=A0A6J1GSG0_CUCMO|nr:uncharacterized protein LOC111456714 [Cucurbita moschata]
MCCGSCVGQARVASLGFNSWVGVWVYCLRDKGLTTPSVSGTEPQHSASRSTHYNPAQYKKCLRKLRNPRKLPQNGLFSVVFLLISRLELLDSLFALLNLTKLEYMCQMSSLNGFATYTNLKASAVPKIIKIGFSSINLIYFFTAGPDEVKCWQIRR